MKIKRLLFALLMTGALLAAPIQPERAGASCDAYFCYEGWEYIGSTTYQEPGCMFMGVQVYYCASNGCGQQTMQHCGGTAMCDDVGILGILTDCWLYN
jgi:hypothetical protein